MQPRVLSWSLAQPVLVLTSRLQVLDEQRGWFLYILPSDFGVGSG